MTSLRVVICDDEPLALDRLSDLLAQCGGVELVGTMLSGSALLADVTQLAPDLIFLDVEMPRIDGFAVVETLTRMSWRPAGSEPLIVFVTAHPETAAAAFDSGALDFISKPIRLERLGQAVARARQARDQREAGRRLRELSAQIEQLKRHRDEQDGDRHLWLQRRSETIRVEIETIDWIAAEGEYVRYHVGGDSYLQRGALSSVASRLAAHGFLRVHRSSIVNPASVVSVERARWGGLSMRLRSGVQVRVGRNFREAVRDLTRSRGA